MRTEQIALQTELAGRTAAYRTAEVRPQVSGIIKERRFREGSRVLAGDVLYIIDSAAYRASCRSRSTRPSHHRACSRARITRALRRRRSKTA